MLFDPTTIQLRETRRFHPHQVLSRAVVRVCAFEISFYRTLSAKQAALGSDAAMLVGNAAMLEVRIEDRFAGCAPRACGRRTDRP